MEVYAMLLEINPQSDVPIYQQICNQLIIGFAQGKIQSGEILPSVRQMADEIGVNMMTVSKAYTALKNEGYIVTDRRNGTKVAEFHPPNESFNKRFEESLTLLLAEAAIHQLSQEEIQQTMATIYQQFIR